MVTSSKTVYPCQPFRPWTTLLKSALPEKPQRKPGGVLAIVNKAASSFKSGKAGDHRNEDMLQDLVTKFGVHVSFITSPNVGAALDRTQFGINHYAGTIRRPVISASSPAVEEEEQVDLDRGKCYPPVSCTRPNDSGSANSFDKRRVKAQIRSLLLPDIVSRKSMEFIADYELDVFCDRYVPRMQGSAQERITQCVRANGWKEGIDYLVGH
ncbi:hypothetical protein VKT23_019308 [Stygiomarasmius scandens]|uniref:Uncharacterized protein n=1 Tax=Marasmiellus scandens TaxID=2682957 RepID=A0ABR1ILX0_9AGAR